LPGVAYYVKKPGDTHYRPFMIDVLRIESGGVAEVLAFGLPELLDAFALPNTLSTEAR
jgi:RNA polymerase sigma-70 factor (ECF subfamily)